MSKDVVAATLRETIALHERVLQADPKPVLAAAEAIVASLRSGGKLLVFGNGGSASDAQHMAAELVGRFQHERAAMAAVALTTDTSVLTSIGNDYGFDRVFVRQIEALGRRGDVALGISTSGGSRNVVAALAAAARRGVRTVALTGHDGGDAGRAAEIHINVPAASTARVQEVHRTLLHVICDLVERAFVQPWVTTKDTKDTEVKPSPFRPLCPWCPLWWIAADMWLVGLSCLSSVAKP